MSSGWLSPKVRSNDGPPEGLQEADGGGEKIIGQVGSVIVVWQPQRKLAKLAARKVPPRGPINFLRRPARGPPSRLSRVQSD